jgi:hypothetical protein
VAIGGGCCVDGVGKVVRDVDVSHICGWWCGTGSQFVIDVALGSSAAYPAPEAACAVASAATLPYDAGMSLCLYLCKCPMKPITAFGVILIYIFLITLYLLSY